MFTNGASLLGAQRKRQSMDGPMRVFDAIRDALGIRRGSNGSPEGRWLQSLPYVLVMGGVAGIAASIGVDFHDDTPTGYALALGAGLLIMLPAALLANPLLRSHAFDRRMVWSLFVAFTLTWSMDDSTHDANLMRIGAMAAVMAVVLVVLNLLAVGVWRPPRRRA